MILRSPADSPGRLLKVDLHTHTAEDPVESIRHTSRELIDRARYLDFDAISITNHTAITFYRYLRDYARERGIVLIPGAEINIRGKHVLAVNAHEKLLRAHTFNDLRRFRTPENLIVAPHPFFPGVSSLMGRLGKNIDVFDAIEFSWFFHSGINFNRFAVRAAAKYSLPLVCTSDCHHLGRFGGAYSLVEAEKETEAIVSAVKAGRVELAANPVNLFEFGRHGVGHVVNVAAGTLRGLFAGGGE